MAELISELTPIIKNIKGREERSLALRNITGVTYKRYHLSPKEKLDRAHGIGVPPKSPNLYISEFMASQDEISNLRMIADRSSRWILIYGDDKTQEFIDMENAQLDVPIGIKYLDDLRIKAPKQEPIPHLGGKRMLSKELGEISLLLEELKDQVLEASYRLHHPEATIYFDLREQNYTIELEWGSTELDLGDKKRRIVRGYSNNAPYQEMPLDDFRIMNPIIEAFATSTDKITE